MTIFLANIFLVRHEAGYMLLLAEVQEKGVTALTFCSFQLSSRPLAPGKLSCNPKTAEDTLYQPNQRDPSAEEDNKY